MKEPLYKVLNEDGSARMGVGKWPLPVNGEPGGWLEARGKLEPYRNGLHLCRRSDLIAWLGPAIYLAEHDEDGGELIICDDKIVVRKARLIKRLDGWNDRTAHLFACDCAERALSRIEKPDPRSLEAVRVSRAYADGEATSNELAVAWDAAWDAAEAVAGAAAWDAAEAVAGAAAWDAAEAVARAAAWDAAEAAAGAAARAAAGAAAGAAARAAAEAAVGDAARAAAGAAAGAAARAAAEAAAGAAVEAAVGDAAGAAAGAAVGDAVGAAVEAAAEAAARAAARAAVGDAVGDAARDAERAWQTEQLFKYLDA